MKLTPINCVGKAISIIVASVKVDLIFGLRYRGFVHFKDNGCLELYKYKKTKVVEL